MLRASQTTWKTDTGRQRKDNEDNAFARAPLFVVADGMGGAQAGEVASQIAVEAFQAELPDSGSPEERLAARAQDANRRIYEISSTEHDRAGMGTTLTAVYVDDAELAVAHVGDSRAYLFREGELGRLTQDHTLVEELLKRGKLTEEQAAEHPQRSIITRALGVDPEVDVDTRTYGARAGDVVLLCSDGLTSMISEKQVAAILAQEPDLDRAAERLIAEANAAGGRDNITVVLFRLEEVEGSAAADGEQPTMVGMSRVPADGGAGPDTAAAHRADAGAAARAGTVTTAAGSGARTSGRARRAPLSTAPGVDRGPRPMRRTRRPARLAKPVAALVTILVLAFLIGGGGYLATRQLFFLGTNSQGIVTVYRGLPYDLPFGVHLYETYYVSGLPLSTVPAARRNEMVNHQIRSQSDAISLVHAAELGQLTR
ncbi:MAG TPA: Stp1/IreP family PP2C-type Ser/Thr phosphatase [Solirubrobacteraceae bacterium]|nr:Stp1/IreP family PP2C-type Ser/Thr phosphatase [Solirubrobacteraceae bacterium]